jgi:hypothetical protein
MQFPRFGSAKFAMFWGGVILGLFGCLTSFTALLIILSESGDIAFKSGLAVIGAGLIIAGVLMVKSGLTPDEYLTLFSLHESPADLIDKAQTAEQREAAAARLEEEVQSASTLTTEDREILRKVESDIKNAPPLEEALERLAQKRDEQLTLANPKLRPIAFALKPTPPTRYAQGVLLGVLAWLTFLVCAPLTIFLDLRASRWVLYLSIRINRRARRYRVSHGALRRDARDPVLYLRSFSDDYEAKLEGFFPNTFEEHLVTSYKRHGPVVAVGRPKEGLPLLGASRLYFDNQDWQAGVRYLMSVSRDVVIHAGIAPGLLWELGVARRTVEPQRLVITFAGWSELKDWERRQHYLRFKKYAEPLLGSELPSEIDGVGQLSFGPDWVANPHPERPGFAARVLRSWVYKVASALGGIALGVAGVYASRYAMTWAKRDVFKVGVYTQAKARWVKYTVGHSGMSVELPVPPLKCSSLDETDILLCEAEDLKAVAAYYPHLPRGDVGKVLEANAKAISRFSPLEGLPPETKKVGDRCQLEWQYTLDEGLYVPDKHLFKVCGFSIDSGNDVGLLVVTYDAENADAESAARLILESVHVLAR